MREGLGLYGRLEEIVPDIEKAAALMIGCLRAGGKVMFAGNGGSAADAQHMAAEFVNRFRKERAPLAGLALTTDTSVLTSISNDYSFEEIFAKQVVALGRKGDVFVGISTSGNSPNIVKAVRAAREVGISSVGLMGKGGALKDLVDCSICVPSTSTPRVQEAHLLIEHILCELVEDAAGGSI